MPKNRSSNLLNSFKEEIASQTSKSLKKVHPLFDPSKILKKNGFHARKNKIVEKITGFVSKLKNMLINLEIDVEEKGEWRAFQEIYRVLYYIQNLRKELYPSDETVFKIYFRNEINPIAHHSEFCKYAYQKPRGYPRDFVMMEMIWNGKTFPHESRYRGDTRAGELINALTLDIDICCANIIRTNEMALFIKNSEPFKIASIGAGSVIELQVLGESGWLKGKEIHLFDQDEGALTYAEEKLKKFEIKIKCHSGNVLKAILKNEETNFDCIYSSGLFDYFSVGTSRKLASKLQEWLSPRGRLMISNVHADNPSKLWMEYVGDWYLHEKRSNEMIEILDENLGGGIIEYDIDYHSSYQYVSFEKNVV